MKIIYFGTPKFSAEILKYLLKNNVNIVAIVTQKDHIRNKKIKASDVKKQALSHFDEKDIYQPDKASDSIFIENLKKYNPDLFVVVAYGQILKQELLDIPKMGCINVHASLLPHLRGAAPMQHSILNGDEKTGVTIQKMVRKMDAGDIIAQKEIDISQDDDFSSLHDKMLSISKPLLLEVLKSFEKGDVRYFSQDEKKVTFAPKITKEIREINFLNSSGKILNKIRAFSIIPGAFCKIKLGENLKELKIYLAKRSDFSLKPKEVLKKDDSIFIGTEDYAIELIEVQMEGKNKMLTKDFLRGLKDQISLV